MTTHRGILYCMTAILLLLVIDLCVISAESEILSFRISSGTDEQSITLWNNDAGQNYVFLPSYAKLEDVRIALHTNTPVSIDGVQLKENMVCARFAEGIPYRFSYAVWGRSKQEEIIFLRSDNVAAMYIETQSGNMDYVHAEKGNKESGALTLYLPDGRLAYTGEIVSIQGRGNSSWTGYQKKPYSIKLAEPGNLLNLGSAQNWIFLANSYDPSHMRNKVIFDFADRLGVPYVPGSNWADLYLNGQYAGLYLLCERNEVHPNRVNIGEDGSFLVSMEYSKRLIEQNDPHIATDAAQFLRIHYPENPTADQLQKLDHIWQSLENAILAEDDVDPVTGKTWMEQIDLDSWVKKYLLEEVFDNYDACFISQFFYCGGNGETGKIHAGPVWDYDNTMGLDRPPILPNIFRANRYVVMDGFDTPWFHGLYQKRIFYERMVEIYEKDFLPLLNEFLYGYIEECSSQIAKAAEMDRQRWNIKEATFDEHAEYLQQFMKKRIAFLDRIWLEKSPYHMVTVEVTDGGYLQHYAFFPWEPLTGLSVLEKMGAGEFLGWYDADTGVPYCLSLPICEDTAIYAKWRSVLTRGEIVSRIITVVFLSIFGGLAGVDLWRRT